MREQRWDRWSVVLSVLAVCVFGGTEERGSGEQPKSLVLRESLQEGVAYRVETTVRLQGRLSVPGSKAGEQREAVLRGEGRMAYTERILTPWAKEGGIRTVRKYHEVMMRRTADDNVQEATIRPGVRRLVMLAQQGQRAPFSPDGPLTWNELDLVRTDPFLPAVLPGLLSSQPVSPGDSWKATTLAVRELTDLDTITAGELRVELIGPAQVQGKPLWRLRLSGEVRGNNADGRHVHRLEGTIYYDAGWPGVVYLSLKGTHQLLDEKGQAAGSIEGYFTLARNPVRELPAELSDASLAQHMLAPTAENTLLLFEDATMGLRFCYPRGWRVGMVRGRQVTLDHAHGAGILFTLEKANQVPSVEAYFKEVAAFLEQRQARWQKVHGPQAVQGESGMFGRFGVQAHFGQVEERLEYAVYRQAERGVTAAARLPAAQAEQLLPEVERVFQSVRLMQRMAER